MPRKDTHTAQRQSDIPFAGGTPLSERARIRRDQWEAALAQCTSRPAGLSPDAVSLQMAQVGLKAVARITRAMLQEGLLQAEFSDDGEARVPIPRSGRKEDVLVLHGLDQSSPSFFPDLRVFGQDGEGALVPIEDPIALLEFVAPALCAARPSDLTRLADEVTDGMLNDALCCAYRSAKDARLQKSIATAHQSTFWGWLKDWRDQSSQTLLLEQWSAVGNPYHPTHKTKLGMTPAEALALCPEFEPEVQIGLVAARRGLTRGETMPGVPPRELWLDHYFPAQAEAWRNELADGGAIPATMSPCRFTPGRRST